MDKSIARFNIEHFRKLLADESDEPRQQMIARLLAEDEARLALMESPI